MVLPTGSTRITENSSTTIDLLISDHPDTIVSAKTATANSISDHEVIYLLDNIRVPEPVAKTISIRNHRGIDVLQLQADLLTKNFDPFFDATDSNTKAALLTNVLKDLLDHHAPARNVTVRDERTPWITPEVEQAAKLRDLAYALYNRNPNRARGDAQWLDYCTKKDRAGSLIFTAKKRYAELHFDSAMPAKKLWGNLRREGIHNNAKRNAPSNDCDPDCLNKFFTDGHRQPGTNDPVPQVEPLHRTATDYGDRAFVFRRTNVNEISLKLFDVHTNATGTDEIPISFLKMLCPFILPHLCHLFNSIIDTRSFPGVWKRAIITPIPKTTNPSQPKDFRPISVLPAVSKILEKILLDQIIGHLEAANPPLLASCQSGYRKGHSTTTALAKVTHDIYNNFDGDRCTVMVLVDFSLAFNCVKHRLLRDKLRDEFLFSPYACDLIASFLEERSQCVRVDGNLSTERAVNDGTPQGSCLSALLFSLYINSLPNDLQCSWQLYADDLQIYVSGPASDVEHLIEQINTDLEVIVSWAGRNHLSPNPKKTQAIVFSKSGSVTPTNAIIFSGETIPLVSQVTNLGLKMDKNMTWCTQVNDVTAKVFGTLKTFRRFAAVLPTETRRKLVQAVIVPFLTYCDIVYYPGLSARLKEQLHRCFKAAIRFVYRLKHRDTTATLRNTILGHDLPLNYTIRTREFMKHAIDETLPEYLLQHLQRGQLQRTRNFIIPQHTTSARKSILVYGALSWNELPANIKSEQRTIPFKIALRNLVRE